MFKKDRLATADFTLVCHLTLGSQISAFIRSSFFPSLTKFSPGAKNASKLKLDPLFATRPPGRPRTGERRYQPSPFQTGSAAALRPQGGARVGLPRDFERGRIISPFFTNQNATLLSELLH